MAASTSRSRGGCEAAIAVLWWDASVYADSAGRKVCAMPLYTEPLRRGL